MSDALLLNVPLNAHARYLAHALRELGVPDAEGRLHFGDCPRPEGIPNLECIPRGAERRGRRCRIGMHMQKGAEEGVGYRALIGALAARDGLIKAETGAEAVSIKTKQKSFVIQNDDYLRLRAYVQEVCRQQMRLEEVGHGRSPVVRSRFKYRNFSMLASRKKKPKTRLWFISMVKRGPGRGGGRMRIPRTGNLQSR